MKKVVCLIAVLALTASVAVADPITITAQGNVPSNGYITIGYSGATGAKPVGFSFIVNVDGTKAEVAAVGDIAKGDSFFDVFIDYAADNPAAYQAGADPTTGVWSVAHPLAKDGEAGAVVLPASVFAVSAAELANVATVPASGTICVLKLTAKNSAASTQVTFAEDTLRGGVVDAAGNPMTVTLPGATTVNFVTDCLFVGKVFSYAGPGPAINLTVTQAMVDNWVTLGKPGCWCCTAQKAGNIVTTSGNASVNNADLNAFRQSFGVGVGAATYNPCADLNISGSVNNADLNILRSHFGLTVGPCPDPQ